MNIPDVQEKWTGMIKAVTIGATKEQGGTRAKTVTVGGQTTFPFLSFEGTIPHRPVVAGFVSDSVPDWPEVVKKAIGKEINSPVEWAQKNARDYGVDLICLKLSGANPSDKDASPETCALLVSDILNAVDIPLIIWGCGDDQKDSLVLSECSQAARGENCLFGSAKETNYLTMVAIAKADKHKLISEAPVDINMGKQINILLKDAGFDLDDCIMYQSTAALGYGFDYVYTILERSRIAGLKGDSLMAMPLLCDIAGEVWRIKEASYDEDLLPGWGAVEKRGPLWEATSAAGYLQAGADILVMAHPEAIKEIQITIEKLL